VNDLSRRPGLLALLSAVREPQIILATLTRLRWLAVVGQIAAVAVAAGPLHLHPPLTAVIAVILVTALSNALIIGAKRLGTLPPWLVQGVLLLDVGLLTALLYLTGGAQNPFASLYVVHVAMAVIVCELMWTWVIVATVAGCYGVLLRWHYPLSDRPLAEWILATGNWVALALVSVLITGFIGRVVRSLRQRELELTAARERAGKNEQLASLTTLAAGAAHELNTPLGTIALVAKEMELGCESSGAAGVMLDDARLIRREVDRCRAILDRMRLDVGEVAEEAIQRGVVRVSELIPRLQESLRDRERRQLDIVCAPDVEQIQAPPRALEQALLVLIRNALDASPPGRPVTLEIGRHDGYVRFDVRDEGCGMSEDVLRRAGQPFFTTKEPGRGMGLGLFLVHLVADRCGANFSMSSKLGDGTRCVLDVPDRGEHEASASLVVDAAWTENGTVKTTIRWESDLP
jgi:two-component system sensor histidine kinase RegB